MLYALHTRKVAGFLRRDDPVSEWLDQGLLMRAQVTMLRELEVAACYGHSLSQLFGVCPLFVGSKPRVQRLVPWSSSALVGVELLSGLLIFNTYSTNMVFNGRFEMIFASSRHRR